MQHFVIANTLGPTLYGNYNTVLLLISYSAFTQLGVLDGLHREIPILRGKENYEEIERVKHVALIFSLFAGLIGCLLLLAAIPFLDVSFEIEVGLIFGSLIILLGMVNDFYGRLFRAENRFGIVSRISVLTAIIRILCIPLILKLKLLGAFMSLALVPIATLCFSFCASREFYSFKFKWATTIFKKMLIIGIPLFLIGYIESISDTVDRLLILNFLDMTELGLYAVPKTINASIGIFIGLAVNSVMYPRIAEQFGKTNSLTGLEPIIMKTVNILKLIVPVLGGIVFITMPALVHIFLPEYMQGVYPAQILTIGTCFITVFGIMNGVYAATYRIFYLYISYGLAIIFNVIIGSMLIKVFDLGIIGVAFGKTVSIFIFVSLLFLIFIRQIGHSLYISCNIYFRILLPMTYCFLLAILIDHFIVLHDSSQMKQFVQEILLRVTIFVSFSFVLLRAAIKRIVAEVRA